MSFADFGFGMLGKLSTNLSDTYGTGNTLRAKQREEVQGDFLERERLGIQARVEGAKAAGLHPLAAMGYQGGNSPSQIIGPSQAPERHAPLPPQAESDPNIDRYNAARARLAEVEATKAERDFAASQGKLATQPGQGIAVQVPTSDANLLRGRLRPGVKLVPDEVTAGSGGLTAGTHPGFAVFESPNTSGLRLPSNALSQATEDMGLLKYWLTYQANKQRLSQYLGEITGLGDLNFKANKSRERAAERKAIAQEIIRLMNQSRVRLGY